MPGHTRSQRAIWFCLLAGLSLLAVGCRGVSKGPSVLIVVFDTTRADHLSCYGYGRATTPTIDSLAACGTLWARCQAASSWTLPSFAAILTGLPPRMSGAGWRDGVFYGVAPELPSLQGILRSEGWNTAAFYNVLFLNEDFGFHRDFDTFDCMGFANAGSLRRADSTASAFLEWLDRSSGEPFFAVVHFYDPHTRYDPPGEWARLFTDSAYEGPYDSTWGGVRDLMSANSGSDTIPAEGLQNLIGLYDGEIAFSDAALASMTRGLRERGLAGNTVVIVLADHGEEFLEHGMVEHGNNLFQQSLHVPLVICGPGVPIGIVDSTLCSHIDIFPTVAGLCGLGVPEDLPGLDLLADEQHSARSVPSSGVLWRETDQACVVDGMKKLIWDPQTASAVVFDLGMDPGETSPAEPDSAGMAEVLDYWTTPQIGHPTAVNFGETVRSALRDLGYIR